MTTIEEVIKYVNETYPELSINGTRNLCMQIWGKIYANQKLDEAETIRKILLIDAEFGLSRALYVAKQYDMGKYKEYVNQATISLNAVQNSKSILSLKDKVQWNT